MTPPHDLGAVQRPCGPATLFLLLRVLLFVNAAAAKKKKDWLIHGEAAGIPSQIQKLCWDNDNNDSNLNGLCGLEMTNGLVTRRWTLDEPAFGTIDLVLHQQRQHEETSLLRALEPEAFLTINGTRYRVGDLLYIGDNEDNGEDRNVNVTDFRGYLNRTRFKDKLRAVPASQNNVTLRYQRHRVVNATRKPFEWTPGTRHSLAYAAWPPKGVGLEIDLELSHANTSLPLFFVTLHYEIYDGIPAMAKWLTIHRRHHHNNNSNSNGPSDATPTFTIDSVTVERIATHPPFGPFLEHGANSPYTLFTQGEYTTTPPPLLVALTDQSHGTECTWLDDYSPNDYGTCEVLLSCQYSDDGPGIQIASSLESKSDESTLLFTSFAAILLLTDSSDPDRHALMKHRLSQILLPHTTENPIFFHAQLDDEGRNNSEQEQDAAFYRLVDQMADVGFEMLIYSFGSSSFFHMETRNQTYLAQIKRQVEYAKARGIEVGGYDLICLARGHGGYGKPNVPDAWVRLDDQGNLTVDACYASGWTDHLHALLLDFVNVTGLSMLELDGPYGGGTCSSVHHQHHHGRSDSVYQQTQIQGDFIRKLRNLGIYLNVPDSPYFFQGVNRDTLGYDEYQYSLPRWQQLTVSRMGLYDDLYRLLPTQGWMFVPLTTQYHSGGDNATFAGHPLELEWALAQYLGAGTAACYRGQYLYNETTATGQRIRTIFKKWINFYKRHREVLIQPIVHLRRPTATGWDGWLHVHPRLDHRPNNNHVEVGLAMIFNPTDRYLRQQDIELPLYYTGLEFQAVITVNEEIRISAELDRDFRVQVALNMPPKSIHTIVVERPSVA